MKSRQARSTQAPRSRCTAKPFGFTHEDLKVLRWAESLLRSGDCGTFYKEADAVESVADRVEALLPPK